MNVTNWFCKEFDVNEDFTTCTGNVLFARKLFQKFKRDAHTCIIQMIYMKIKVDFKYLYWLMQTATLV